MTEHKFTDEEVIRALGCCGRICDCNGCALDRIDTGDLCTRTLIVNALDLINRQKAEINSLEDTLCGKISASAAAIIANETENLKEAERALKSEAVKEFAKRLKTYYRNLDKTAGALIEYHIDEIVKEMLEGG